VFSEVKFQSHTQASEGNAKAVLKSGKRLKRLSVAAGRLHCWLRSTVGISRAELTPLLT